METLSKIAVLILAAGEASRMKRPKQLLPWQDSTLLNHSINIASSLKNTSSFVVLGAYKDEIISTIDNPNVTVLYHENWQQGMGTSIGFGVKSIQSHSDFDAILIVLADQPLVTISYLEELIQVSSSSEKGIVASQYEDNKLGVPVIFDAAYFKLLAELKGDQGAKGVLKNYEDDVFILQASDIVGDIDTYDAYTNLYKKHH